MPKKQMDSLVSRGVHQTRRDVPGKILLPKIRRGSTCMKGQKAQFRTPASTAIMRSAGRCHERTMSSPPASYFAVPRSRSALVMTETELKLIASAAIIGDNSCPVNG